MTKNIRLISVSLFTVEFFGGGQQTVSTIINIIMHNNVPFAISSISHNMFAMPLRRVGISLIELSSLSQMEKIETQTAV